MKPHLPADRHPSRDIARADEKRNHPDDRNGDDPALLDLARAIDPPGQEVSDDELKDPGASIPDGVPPARGNARPPQSGRNPGGNPGRKH